MSREALIKGLWPDKALYGSVLLFVTALVGVLYGLVDVLVGGIAYGGKVPDVLHYSPGMQAFLSLVSAALAWVALKRRETKWAFGGAAAGVTSLGMLGLGALFALLALGFLLLSRAEGEHASDATASLTEDMWPDKALAASMTILVTGVITILWGALLVLGVFEYEMASPQAYGAAGVLAGLLCLVAAWGLYHQRWPWLGLVAAVAGIAATGMYVVGPLLALATIVLVWMAWREKEFEHAKTRS